jgi:hypothetical protein
VGLLERLFSRRRRNRGNLTDSPTQTAADSTTPFLAGTAATGVGAGALHEDEGENREEQESQDQPSESEPVDPSVQNIDVGGEQGPTQDVDVGGGGDFGGGGGDFGGGGGDAGGGF